MGEKILFVDDDPRILSGLERKLMGQFDVSTALGPEKGLETLRTNGPYAVIISDMKMPEMTGAEFLSRAREIAAESVRMMLTGYAEIENAIKAVNEGNVFRFLTKPCPTDILINALNDGIRQYQLIRSEKELLEKTLSGSVKVLVDILSLSTPIAFGRASRIRANMAQFADKLGIEDKWQFELAGMLSQTGCITLPSDILVKIDRKYSLSNLEMKMYESHPKIGSEIIANIPRLSEVANVILYQEKNYDGTGVPEEDVQGENIPLGSRVLHICLGYDSLIRAGNSSEQAIRLMKAHPGIYDPDLMKVLEIIIKGEEEVVIQTIRLRDLMTGNKLANDIKTNSGTLLVASGQVVSPALKERLRNFSKSGELEDSVDIFVPNARIS